MADRENLTSLLVRIAGMVGIGATAAQRAASSAQEAKEAAETAKAATIQSRAERMVKSAGGVVSGMPPGTENARTITSLLADWRQEAFSHSKDKPGEREAKTQVASQPVISQWTETSQTVRSLAEPIPPPRATRQHMRDRKRDFWSMAKGVGRELMGLPGSNVNPILPEDAEPSPLKAKPLSRPPLLPGIKGKMTAVRERTGAWMADKGVAMGGRIGGAIAHIGRFAAGGAGVAASGGAVAGAAGAGGGGGAGAVAAGGAAAGGGGFMAGIAASLSNPITATVAAIGALGLAAIGVTKAFRGIAEGIMENSRELQKFSPAIARTMATLDRQQLMLAGRTAMATSGSASMLGGELGKLREEMQPMNEAMGNLANIGGTALVEIARAVNTVISPVMKAINATLPEIAELFGYERDKPGKQLPFIDFLAGIKDGPPQPRNRRPGE